MKQGFLRSSRYSPGNMDPESLEALFVGRDDVMEDVLSRVVNSVQSPDKHYILLVGPRGSGKTHFLALAYHRLMNQVDAANVQDSVAVALLNEEEWGVASFLDLLVRILRALSDQSPNLGTEIDEIYERFSRDPADAEMFALAQLRQHTRGRTLLLLCENLVDLFAGLGEEGQKRWRAAIQEDGNWAIVASTPSLFAGLTLQDNPFYGFFTIRALEKIDLETGLQLLAKKALHEGKMELAGFLRTPLGRARARAIHHLAAGNHRAYVVLFDFLDKESLEDLVVPFMRMIDDLTPYYQDRMRQLAPAQRKIVEFLCIAGKPTTIKDISTPCLMSQQTAAKQIGELEAAGFVSRMRYGRNTFCELSEPLMRICIEVKDNKTQHFRLFVELLRHWFTARELESRHQAFQHDGLAAVLDRVHVEEAVRCSLADRHEPFVEALDEEGDRCWDSGDYTGLATIQQTLVRDRGRAEDYRTWVLALVEAGDAQAAIVAGEQAASEFPNDADLQYWLTRAFLSENRFADALSAINQAISLEPEDYAYFCLRADVLLRLERFEDAIRDAEAVLDGDPGHWHSHQQIINALVPLDRLQDAEAHARSLVQLAPAEPDALLAASSFYYSQGRLDQALELVDNVLLISASNQQARHLRGLVFFEMQDYTRASEELRQYASQHPHSVSAHCRLADSLLFGGDYGEAIEVAKRLIEIEPTHTHAYYVRGRAMIELGHSEDGIAALDELLSTDDCHALLGSASLVRGVGNYAATRRFLDRVVDLQPSNRELWIERTRLEIDEGALDAAIECAAKLETLPDGALMGRLLAAQAQAATEPLSLALKTLGAVVEAEEFESDELLHLEAAAEILSASVRNFGPRYLPEGVAKLRILFADLLGDGVLGDMLAEFLIQNVDYEFMGSLKDWESALESIASSLSDLPNCQIPVEMLQVAARYAKTRDEKHLLSLPLEQRQLLEDIQPSLVN